MKIRNKVIEERLYGAVMAAPINLKDYLMKKEVDIMTDKEFFTNQEESTKKTFNYIPVLALATAVVFFLAGFFGYYMPFRSVDSVIYLDVNPSVEIFTNRQEKVLTISPVNDDAKDFLSGYEYRGKDLDEVSTELIERFIEQGFLTESNNTILISVKNSNDEKSKEQKERLNIKIIDLLRDNEIEPFVLAQSIMNGDDWDDEKLYDISRGKLIFIGKMLRAESDLEIQDLVGMSLEELIALAIALDIDLEDILNDDESESDSDYDSDETSDDESESDSDYDSDETSDDESESDSDYDSDVTSDDESESDSDYDSDVTSDDESESDSDYSSDVSSEDDTDDDSDDSEDDTDDDD